MIPTDTPVRNFPHGHTLILCGVLFLFLFGGALLVASPAYFPTDTTVTVSPGSTITETADMLAEQNIIRSASTFSLLARLLNPTTGVLANTYSLQERENAVSLAYRLTRGITGIKAVKVTIPEGLNNREIGEILAEKLSGFDAAQFGIVAAKDEGYLFPDTYYVVPGTAPEVVITMMRSNFNAKVQPLQTDIRASGKTINEIVTMASLLEEEARKPETRKIISGILWKRIELEMPLQVDAVFGYILGKSGYAPTLDDLKIKSPYNTYMNRGLPPTPITNPGFGAIEAAAHPTATEYLYYLTGADGVMYYAKTFEQHKANKSKLR